MTSEEERPVEGVDITRYGSGGRRKAEDVVAREEPLEIILNDTTLAFLMRLPGDDVALAVGFCFSEGLIEGRRQLEIVQHCTQGGPESEGGAGEKGRKRLEGPADFVRIRAKEPGGVERFNAARVVRTGCGAADLSVELDLTGIRVESDAVFSPSVISGVPDLLLERQEIFRSTGGTHGAGAFDAAGRLLVAKEDVGRHNAVDKVLGYLMLSGEETRDLGLILSGRLSFEMVLKCARAGIGLVCSVSAPTALGVEVGKETGVTLVGFLRDGNFNVYSHPERVGET